MVKAPRLLFVAHRLLDFLTSAHSKKYMYRSHNLAPTPTCLHAHTHTHTHTQWGWKFPKQNLPLQCAWLSGKSPCSCFYVQTNAALGSSVGSVTFWVDVCSLKTAVWFGVSADFLPTPAGTPEHASLHTSCLCMEHLEPRGGTGRTETAGVGRLAGLLTLSCVPSPGSREASLRLFL